MRKRNYTNKNQSGRTALSVVASIVLLVVGLIISIPFVVDIVEGITYHYLGWEPIFKLVAFLIGSPMFLMGSVTLLAPSHRNNPNPNMDVARIRFTVENDSRNKR